MQLKNVLILKEEGRKEKKDLRKKKERKMVEFEDFYRLLRRLVGLDSGP
jgi:hypothetical protein